MKLKITRKIVTISLIVVAAIVCVVSTVSLIVPSYLEWKDYYDQVMAEKDSQDTEETETIVEDGEELTLIVK